MDSLSDILSNKNFDVPEEVSAIKNYVLKNYEQSVAVSIHRNEIVVSSPSAGLISNLRLNSQALAKATSSNKRISFRVG